MKSGFEQLQESAAARGADVALFGHTHYKTAAGGHPDPPALFNPGSLRDGVYLRAEAKDGQFHYQPERMD